MMRQSLAVFSSVLALVLVVGAQQALAVPTVRNGSFEKDTYLNGGGGTAQQNGGVITDWTLSADTSLMGLNPFWTDAARTAIAGRPHGNNGLTPDGDQSAYVRNDGSLSQDIPGFQTGRYYHLTYRESNRAGGTHSPGSLAVLVEGAAVVADHATTPVEAANSFTQPYRFVSSNPFQASGSNQSLTIQSTSGLDRSVLVDDVQLSEVVLFDSFTLDDGTGTGGGALDGAAPEVSLGPASWSNPSGNAVFGGNATNGFAARSGGGGASVLPVTVTGDETMLSLSALINPGPTADWTAIGFTDNAGTGSLVSDGVLWVLLRQTGNFVFHANETGGLGNQNGGGGRLEGDPGPLFDFNANAFNEVTLQWDLSANEASLFINGSEAISGFDLSNAANTSGVFAPAVAGAGLHFNSAGQVDDFMLTRQRTVPEPGSAVLVALAGLGVMRRRRR